MAPSERHNELTSLAIKWLTNRSFKIRGVTEANFVGYSADYAAIAGMYDSEHSKYTRLSGLTKKYMIPAYGDKEYQIKGEMDRWYVCVFEVKVSRADFLNTFGGQKTPHAKARMAPVGTAHWVVADKNVCKPEELPEFWGLLTPYGSGLTEKKMPKLNVLPDSTIHAMAFDLLWLQMNTRSRHYNQTLFMADNIRTLHKMIAEGRPMNAIEFFSRKLVRAVRLYH